ncbi:hypothetical protein [Mesorhizobium argentiipisi]|uniref:Uncharacterized protein n=1 Tax=Mesorhizobium argentiipisi TaxID=3015175 RepID=A0ABU8KFA6_9HYPH
MVEIFSFELAKARLRVNRAERSLNRSNELLDQGGGNVAVNLSLCDRIRSQQRRVAEARERLMKLNTIPRY